MDKSNGILPVFITALPLPDLNHPAVFLCSFLHELYLLDAVGKRLFTIHLFPGLACVYKWQTMPMVRCTDNNHINRFVLEQFPEVFVDSRPFTLDFLNFSRTGIQYVLINVANGSTFGVGLCQKGFQVGKTHTIDTNCTGNQFIIGTQYIPKPGHRHGIKQSGTCGNRQAAGKQFTSRQMHNLSGLISQSVTGIVLLLPS